MKTIPTWNLSTLFKTEKELHQLVKKIEERANRFTHYRKQLEKPSRMLINTIMEEKEKIHEEMNKVGAYAHLQFSQNTQDEKAKTLESQIGKTFTRIGNKMLFFDLWWKKQDEKKARSLLPQNKEYTFILTESRKHAKYALSEKEEQLANIKDDTGEEALLKVYNILTNAYTFPWKSEGKTTLISEEELKKYFKSPNPKEREEAYDLLWEKSKKESPVLGEIYRNLVLDYWNEGIHLRKYKSPVTIRNMGNDLRDEIVDTFLDVCEKNTEIFQDYFEWKMKKIRVPLSRYHVYAPLPHPRGKWTFEEGYETVMQAYEEFSPRFKEEAHRVLKEKRMDAQLRKGKRGGAFCMGIIPGETSFVLLNWMGNYHDLSTLAHELGHATHNHLAGKHSIFTHHAGLPLAETASTFSEMLLNEKILRESKDAQLKQYILAHQIDDAYASIQRQSYFCLFEKEAFNLIQEGKTMDDVHHAYSSNLRKQFGKKMHIPKDAMYEWLNIPHLFEQPFYVYAYAFGQLLVYAFYQQYEKEGNEFVKRYEKFLTYGGSEHPEKMLIEMGFDPAKKRSWTNGFDFLEKKLQHLKKMEE
ncbi:MAG: M3 family oligoendopeptidase [Candidatus Diapherotrites archaeon]